MKLTITTLGIIAVSAISSLTCGAASLASFTFDGGSLANSAAAITGLTVTNVSTASSFNSFVNTSGFSSGAQISGAGSFFSPTSQAAAGNALVFTLTAASGYQFSLDGFSFEARSTGDAPANIGFKVNTTSYSFAGYSNNATKTTVSNSALGLTGLSSATISIQGWTASGTSALQLDDLLATGTVIAIPEPSAAVLSAFGLLALLGRRRR
ncbi:hypothetical protein [Luteolibacter sp. AS25]|uniref:hypothetical protein n=1 Tax=Luteolibacter sp. AS25 TaxID=3135776 RepID=UPI00398AE5B3